MIEFNNAGFEYPDKSVIGPVHLSLKRGEVHLLTGKSGSGKTSIIKMANGIIDHLFEGKKYGEVLIEGKNISDLSIKDLIATISSVYQNPKTQFFTDHTTSELVLPLENLGYPLNKMKELLDDVSSFFGIESLLNKKVAELSGGEKQILCIAGSVMANPALIVLDEPTANLDLASVYKVREMIRKLKQLKKTILISEHRLNYLNGLVDSVSLILDGKIERSYSGKEFYNLSETERKAMNLRCMNPTDTYSEAKESSSENGIEIRSLSCKIKKREVVNIRNLYLKEGRIYFLVGKNGEGKSTFAKSLSGLTKTRNDTVFLNGRKISSKQRLKSSYLVFQDVNSQLFTSSIAEEITLNHPSSTLNELLSDLDLSHKKDAHPQSLSGGEKQRVSLAAGIASNKKIFIADEPTSGMDYSNMISTCELLRKYAAKGHILLIISHDIEFLSELADEILFMEQGRILKAVRKDKAVISDVIRFLS